MLSSILLQIGTAVQDTAAGAAIPTTEIVHQNLSVWDLIVKGGPVMYFIGFLSVALVYLFIERWMVVRKALKSNDNFMNEIKSIMLSGNVAMAKTIAQNNATPIGKMVDKGLSRLGKPVKEIESAMENMGKVELARVEKNVGYLSTIAAIAPMFGFVGTIFGVITIFYNISLTGDFGIQTISGGLYQKMVTSAAGLIIGIMAFIAHHILANMIDRLTAKMEIASMEFLDILSEPSK
jgi:biopolymer transport protein ExbB